MTSKIQLTSRATIENKLLMALDGDTHVAAVFSKADLDELVWALGMCPRSPRIESMYADLQKLRASAFPGEK